MGHLSEEMQRSIPERFRKQRASRRAGARGKPGRRDPGSGSRGKGPRLAAYGAGINPTSRRGPGSAGRASGGTQGDPRTPHVDPALDVAAKAGTVDQRVSRRAGARGNLGTY